MKRIASLVIAAGVTLGLVSGAWAVDFKAGGSFEMGYYYANHSAFTNQDQDRFGAATRIQFRLDAVANENLRGVYQMRVGTTSWGRNGNSGVGPSSGFGIGTQGVNVRTLEAYLSFRWPDTNLKFRMGLMPMSAPQAVKGKYTNSIVMMERAAGLEATYDFNKNVSVVAHWMRLANDGDGVISNTASSRRHSKMDLFLLSMPVRTDWLDVTPWGMYSMVGRNAKFNVGNSPYYLNSENFLPNLPDTTLAAHGKDGKIWWGGLALDVKALDNWILKGDVIYGRYKSDYDAGGIGNAHNGTLLGGTGDPKRAGWMVDLQIGYKMDHFTPTLIAFYATGDDTSDLKNNKSGRLPVISNLGGWTSLGGTNSIAATSDAIDRKLMCAQGYTGMWGVMLALEDIKFIDKLTSTFRVLYLRGTNDNEILKEWAKSGKAADPWYLGKSDSAWEFNFNHEYKLYENLGWWAEFGYIIMDRKSAHEPVGNHEMQSKNAYSLFTGFYYKF